MLVGICGLIGSGKDTVGNYLCNEKFFVKDSFAKSLKDILAIVFDWDRKLLEGDTKESRDFRNKVDQWWSDRLNIPNLTPRLMMQIWGTDLVRKYFNDEFWISTLERRLTKSGNIVISDVRFQIEAECIKKHGGIIIYIERELPFWYNIAINACNGDKTSIDKMRLMEIHESEWGLYKIVPDIRIKNDGTIEDLYKKIELIINRLT